MIYVTHGSPHSVNIEIFIKAFLTLPKSLQKQFVLIGNRDIITGDVEKLKIKCTHKQSTLCFGHTQLSIEEIPKDDLASSALAAGIDQCERDNKNGLITLPVNKNDLHFDKKPCVGHTDYLRKKFPDHKLSMCFISEHHHVLLATEHCSLAQMLKFVGTSQLGLHMAQSLSHYLKLNPKLENVYIAGVNPHAGEEGLIGNEDAFLATPIKQLKAKFKQLNICGPFAGDTLILRGPATPKSLHYYMYHDQGLGAFKALNGFYGINATLGLPFYRMSVDHGTAKELCGKNEANYYGMLYLLEYAYARHQNGHHR